MSEIRGEVRRDKERPKRGRKRVRQDKKTESIRKGLLLSLEEKE
jgi:hypothetical protein